MKNIIIVTGIIVKALQCILKIIGLAAEPHGRHITERQRQSWRRLKRRLEKADAILESVALSLDCAA